MMKARITEIFSSIQGEGKYAGVRQIFVRFSDCDRDCVWCDTPLSKGKNASYEELTLRQALARIDALWENHHSVSLTGGEPLLQAEFIKGLLPALKRKGRSVYLETNGILYKALKQIVHQLDFIAMDIKLPSSTRNPACWKEHEAFLEIASLKELFIKMVITRDTLKQDIHRAVEICMRHAPDACVVLQPNSFELSKGVLDKCLAFQKYCLKYLPDVRIMPQMHKFLKLK